MATGELVEKTNVDLAYGEALTANGRISAARRIVPAPLHVPFNQSELARLDEALTLSSRETGLSFSVYLGDPTQDSTADFSEAAKKLHATIGSAAADAVLIVVSPQHRMLEVVTGERAHRRLADRACKLAVMSMVASFKEGDLIGGLISGLRMLCDQAGAKDRA